MSPVHTTESLWPCRGNHRALTLISNWSRLVRASLLLVDVCFLVAILVGCQQLAEPVSYEDLCGLASGQMGAMDEEDVRRWIEEEYDHIPTRSQRTTNGETVVIYIWEYDGITGNAYLRGGSLFRISLLNVENGPTFGQVVAGLGPPEMIDRSAGTHEPLLYKVALDYPTLGVSVSTHNTEKRSKLLYEGELAAPLTRDLQVDYVHCYTPDSMEQILHEVFLVSHENVPYHMRRRLPWPGFGALVSLEY
jgi:hypothetical protein